MIAATTYDAERAKRSPAYRRAWAHHQSEHPPRWYVYNEMPYRFVEVENKPSMLIKRLAALLFDEVRTTGAYKRSKPRAKEIYLAHLLHALQIAVHRRGTVAFARNYHHPAFSKIRCQMVDSLAELGYVIEERSSKGRGKMTRLLPTARLRQHLSADPWTVDKPGSTETVFVRDRLTGYEVKYDATLDIPKDTAHRLEQINSTLARATITYKPFNEWDDSFWQDRLQLRPFFYALFTDGFDQHGRLYTGKYGHQELKRVERETVQFNGEPSVELDYSGMHPRMLYHLEGIAYDADPYALWGEVVLESKRKLAKKVVNALINAKSEQSALSSCNNQLGFKRLRRHKKTGELREFRRSRAERNEAALLHHALKINDLSFAGVLKQAKRHHRRIAHRFGTDAGMELMRLDACIALDVMTEFADQGIPCLGVHDSFLVAQRHAPLLREVMLRCYRNHLGFNPVIK